ncbi:MAG: hypothetical protein ABIJ18_03120 [archaeon]
MAGNKTRDGIKLSKIVSSLGSIQGMDVRPGRNHPYVARMEGYQGSCPIATSTDVKKMVVPWLKKATGIDDNKGMYQSLKKGEWAYAS